MLKIDVVGLGVSTIDIVTLVDHFPAQEEIQRALDMTVQGGGPVATAIVALARLGARAAMLDAVGDDWRGSLILEEFRQEGVETGHIQRCPGRTSATACVLVQRETGARTIVYLPGTTPELSPRDLPREAIESARILHMNGRHPEACPQACRWARAAGALVSFDGGADRYRPEMRALLPLTDICIVARDFAEKYSQEKEIPAAAARLLGEGPRLVVVTDGTLGSWIYPRDGRAFHQPAYRVPEVVDTTGCGDAYHGAFLFGLLQGWPLEKVASHASAAAALNAQHLGGRRGLPNLEAVEGFLARLQST
jgi:sulfofructose kinase